MCSRFSTRRPRLCTIWTAVAPEAVFTRRTKAPTPRDYPRRQAPLVTTSAPIHGQTPTSAAPTITRSPERYKSGQSVNFNEQDHVLAEAVHAHLIAAREAATGRRSNRAGMIRNTVRMQRAQSNIDAAEAHVLLLA